MAGPVASILFENELSTLSLDIINYVIEKISDRIKGTDFWVVTTEPIDGSVVLEDGRPFGIDMCARVYDDFHYERKELDDIKGHIGFMPEFELNFHAMSNQDVDHKIMGELVYYIARQFKGFINYGGRIPQLPATYVGHLWEISYNNSEGIRKQYHVSDPVFLKYYLQLEPFRLLK